MYLFNSHDDFIIALYCSVHFIELFLHDNNAMNGMLEYVEF